MIMGWRFVEEKLSVDEAGNLCHSAFKEDWVPDGDIDWLVDRAQ